MSKDARGSPCASASSIVRPRTNSAPRMRTARDIAARATDSPTRPARRPIQPLTSPVTSSPSAMTPPVSISAQVEALRNSESEWPRCRDQLALAIFSATSASAVSSSGMRSSASLMHMSAMPSSLERPNSCRKRSRVERSLVRARHPATRSRARASTRSRCCSERGTSAKRACTASRSLKRPAWVIAAQPAVVAEAGLPFGARGMALALGLYGVAGLAAFLPATRPNTAPDVSPLPPG